MARKLRVKETGEILNISPYAKIQVDYCDSYGNPIEFGLDEVEVLSGEESVPIVCTVEPMDD